MRIRITYINHPCRFAIWSGRRVGYLHIYSNLPLILSLTDDLCYFKWLNNNSNSGVPVESHIMIPQSQNMLSSSCL